MERLFSEGLMQMGPSRIDPNRQVGVFKIERVAGLPALRIAELQKFAWIQGEWEHENTVPATRVSPAYSDIGTSCFGRSEDGTWICALAADGRATPQITFDPFSRQWIYLLMRGSYGLLRSTEGWVGNSIAFTGAMTMIGINLEWRMRWTKYNDDAFGFVNEEQNPDGSWAYIDEWRFHRKA
ncbi:MAG: hypothetical protein WCC26_09880 [Terracidiphilus sp.]